MFVKSNNRVIHHYHKSKILLLFAMTFGVLSLNINLLYSQNILQLQKIVANNRVSFDEFGEAVSIYGDYAVVGVPASDTDPSDDNGAAFVYKRDANNNWSLIKRLVPSDQQSYGFEAFGSSVDIYDEYIIVGSVYTATFNGGVYIYKKDQGGTDNWGEIKKLEASDAAVNDFFGDSGISIYGDYIVVGATSEDHDANGLNFLISSGSAYIFKKNQGGADNWGQIKKITAPVRAASDFFGGAVSIYGDYVIVGSNYEDEDANGLNTLTNPGAVYIYKKNQGGADNWGYIKKIVASDRANNDEFGRYLDIYGDYIVVGVYNEDEDVNGLNTLSNSGSAYIYKKDEGGSDNWGEIKKITAPVREDESYFGSYVSIYNGYIAVGEPYSSYDENNLNVLNASGAAYVFKQNEGGADNWGFLKKIVSNDRAVDDFFGYAVGISNDYVISLATRNDYDVDGNNLVNAAGAGYIFQILPEVSLNSITNLYDKSAVISATIDADNNLSISNKGFVWSQTSNPTINSTLIKNSGSGFSAFNTTITSLTPRTKYYLRAFAITEKYGIAYSDEITFTTKETIIIDGNQDEIDDTLQVNVETILNSKSNTYITIESIEEDTLYEVTNLTTTETEYNYPFGLYGFKIKASKATVKLYFHGYSDLNGYSYRKLLPNGSYFNYQNAIFSTETILGEQTAVVTLNLIDGEAGDYDGIINGIIHDPGGPAIFPFSSADIPSLSEWARIIMLSSFALFGVWSSSKKFIY